MVVKIGDLQVHCVQYSNLSVQNHFWNKTALRQCFGYFPIFPNGVAITLAYPKIMLLYPLDLPLPLCLCINNLSKTTRFFFHKKNAYISAAVFIKFTTAAA